jgi:hypothetical protein
MNFKNLASFHGLSLPVQKILRILEQCEQILKRPNQETLKN